MLHWLNQNESICVHPRAADLRRGKSQLSIAALTTLCDLSDKLDGYETQVWLTSQSRSLAHSRSVSLTLLVHAHSLILTLLVQSLIFVC